MQNMKQRLKGYFKKGLSKDAILYISYKEYMYGKISLTETDKLIEYINKFDFVLGTIPE